MNEREGALDRDELLSKLAHELRTPLTAIAGYAELLEMRDDERTRREAAAQIKAAADRLLQTIDSLIEEHR